MGTSWSITNPDGTRYSEGQGILTSTSTGEMATYTFQAIGQYGSDGKLRNHGSVSLIVIHLQADNYLF